MTKMYSLVFNKTIRNPIYYVETRPDSETAYATIVVELCWLSSRIDKVMAQVDCGKKEEAILWHEELCRELKVKSIDAALKYLQEKYPPTEEEIKMNKEKEVKKKSVK